MGDKHNDLLMVEVGTDAYGTVINKCKDWGVEKILAISGGSEAPPGVEPKRYAADMKALIETVIAGLKGRPIAILCGGTKGGVPTYAATAAKEAGLRVIGIYPSRGREYVLGPEFLDYTIEVGPIGDISYWGDESLLFSTLPNAVMVVGGRTGTLIEIAHILRVNQTRVKNGDPIKIIPVGGTLGVADMIRSLPMDERVRAHAIPDRVISTADEVVYEVFEHFDMA